MERQKPIQLEDNSVPVVVLVSSQHGGVGIIRSLGRAGIPVYGVHRDFWEPASRSRFLKQVFRWDFFSAPPEASISFLRDVSKADRTAPAANSHFGCHRSFRCRKCRNSCAGISLFHRLRRSRALFCQQEKHLRSLP